MTALMWCCLRVTHAVDPARLLLTLGASTSMRDNLHGNTPLHWAILAKNLHAVTILTSKVCTLKTVNFGPLFYV